MMFPLHFHYEDILRQDLLLKLNYGNVPGSYEIESIHPAFLLILLSCAIFFIFGVILLKMENISGISGITVASTASTAGSNPNRRRRRRSNTQKAIRRYFARWLKEYAANYGLHVPGYTGHDWSEIADIMLNKEYDYMNSEKSLSELNAILREIREQRLFWPNQRDEHPLSETFDYFFD